MDLPDIADRRLARILRCIDGEQTTFWYASYAGCSTRDAATIDELGFDNVPLAGIADPYPILFFEQLFGCELLIEDKEKPSFFNTWPLPIVNGLGDISALSVDLDSHAVWQGYWRAVSEYLADTPDGMRLPVAAKGFYPLDLACNMCGTQNLFTWMCEAEDEITLLLTKITDLFLDVWERMRATGLSMVTGTGFPCANCSDLQLPSISPDVIRRVVLPCYRRVARACGGTFLALYSADLSLLEEVMAQEWVTGCSFDKRLPLPEIKQVIGDKVFMLPNYAYDDQLDRPTPRDGIYWNPIVQCHGRDVDEVYSEMNGHCSMVVTIERPTLAEVVQVRDRLRSGRPTGDEIP